MIATINGWSKIKSGVYGSNQKTFSYSEEQYVPLFIIKKVVGGEHGDWSIYVNKKDRAWFVKSAKSLKAAKAYVELQYGAKVMSTDYDKAMQGM